MSRLIPVSKAAKILSLHPSTIKKWIKKGIIDAEKVAGIFLIPEVELDKAKEILKKSKGERQKEEVTKRGIPRLYKLCTDGGFKEVAAELELPEPPKNVKDCFSVVKRVWKEKK